MSPGPDEQRRTMNYDIGNAESPIAGGIDSLPDMEMPDTLHNNPTDNGEIPESQRQRLPPRPRVPIPPAIRALEEQIC